jgi:hypothetical protein
MFASFRAPSPVSRNAPPLQVADNVLAAREVTGPDAATTASPSLEALETLPEAGSQGTSSPSNNEETNAAASVIRVMDTCTIHRMVAGQAVADLASAVKELVDNALDAGATRINSTFERKPAAPSLTLSDKTVFSL